MILNSIDIELNKTGKNIPTRIYCLHQYSKQVIRNVHTKRELGSDVINTNCIDYVRT